MSSCIYKDILPWSSTELSRGNKEDDDIAALSLELLTLLCSLVCEGTIVLSTLIRFVSTSSVLPACSQMKPKKNVNCHHMTNI